MLDHDAAPSSSLVAVGHAPWSATPGPPSPKRPKGFRRETVPSRIDGVRGYGFSVELLNAYCEDAGWSVAELAQRAGVNTMLTSNIARGVYEPTEPQVRAYAAALGIDPWALTWA
jgi:ribosome-binding protein aMBF1 (putative translation factor)